MNVPGFSHIKLEYFQKKEKHEEVYGVGKSWSMEEVSIKKTNVKTELTLEKQGWEEERWFYTFGKLL